MGHQIKIKNGQSAKEKNIGPLQSSLIFAVSENQAPSQTELMASMLWYISPVPIQGTRARCWKSGGTVTAHYSEVDVLASCRILHNVNLIVKTSPSREVRLDTITSPILQ